MSRFSIFCRKFIVSQCRKYSQVNPFVLFFRKFQVAKKFMDKRGGGVSRYSVENFLPHSAYNFRRGISIFCPNYGYRKSLDKRGGGVSRNSVENFLFHSAYNFRRGILYFCSIFGYRKSLDKRWGECQDLPSEKFCLTVQKIFIGESFTIGVFLGTGKVWITKGGGEYQDFPSK